MAQRKSTQVANRAAALAAMGAACAIPLVMEHTIVAGQFAAGDIVEMGALPAGCVPVAPAVLVADDADSNGTPTLTLDLGLMSGDYLSEAAGRTCGAEFFSASNVAQAGGIATQTLKAGLQITPSLSDRSIGLKVNAAAATLTAGAKIRVLMLVAPAPVGMAVA